LKDERERIERGLGGRKKEKVQGVFGQTAISFLPSIQNIEGGIDRAAGRQGRSPAVPCTAMVGRWGKMERRPRGSQPHAYLGLRWFVGAAPREGAAAGVPQRRANGRWC
jgi:hypothetical protein